MARVHMSTVKGNLQYAARMRRKPDLSGAIHKGKLRTAGGVRHACVQYKSRKQWHRQKRRGSAISRMTEHATLKEHPSAQYKANMKNGLWQKSLGLRGKVAITKPVG